MTGRRERDSALQSYIVSGPVDVVDQIDMPTEHIRTHSADYRSVS